MNADRLLALIDQLYASPGVAEGWQVFLTNLQNTLSGSAVSLISHDMQDKSTIVDLTTWSDPSSMREYRERWSSLDPWAYSSKLPLVPAGKAVLGDELIAHSQMRSTAFYNEFARRYDVVRCVVGMIDAGPRIVSGLSVNRTERRGPFGSAEVALLDALTPHLQRALQLHRRLTAAEATCDGLANAIDHSPRGVMLVDHDGRVTFANRAASDLVEMRDGLTLDAGELRAARATDTARLRALIGGSIRTSNGDGVDAGGMLRIGRPSGRPPFLVLVCPLSRHHMLVPGASSRAIVFVTHYDQFQDPSVDALGKLWGLTPAEARLARLLARGRSLAEAADELRIRCETARTCLKTIFTKTATHTQTGLARLVFTTIGQIGQES